MRTVSLAVIAVVLLLAYASSQNPSYQPDPNWRVPPGAAERQNPLSGRPELAAGGEKLFKRNCVECHGENGMGVLKKHAADLRLPMVQAQSDGALFWKITNGNADRGMPAFSRLPEMQRWQLVLYLRTLKAGAAKLAAKGAEST